MAHEPTRTDWDSRLIEYQKRSALLNANRLIGPLKTAERLFDEEKRAIKAKYGNVHAPEATDALEQASAEISAAEAAHYLGFVVPLDQAAIALALTPAPDLEAALLKVSVMTEFELDNHTDMPRDPMEIALEDMGRVAAMTAQATRRLLAKEGR